MMFTILYEFVLGQELNFSEKRGALVAVTSLYLSTLIFSVPNTRCSLVAIMMVNTITSMYF